MVVDASVALWTCIAGVELPGAGEGIHAPPLMWSEATSALHSAKWRGELSPEHALLTQARLEAAPIERAEPPELRAVAWRLADDLGWAKTYDAEYLALAQLLGTRLVTVDQRLRRGAERTGLVVTPDEL